MKLNYATNQMMNYDLSTKERAHGNTVSQRSGLKCSDNLSGSSRCKDVLYNSVLHNHSYA